MKSVQAVALLALFACLQVQAAEPVTKVTSLMTKPLVGVEGQEATMITVELPPGADSPPHRHHASTFVYVLEGTVVMQVQGAQPVTLQAGETFYESPTDIHVVSRNASRTEPAKLLVVLVKAAGAPITMPVK